MKFTFSWFMDKLGYMPKFDMKIGKIADPWPFPAQSEPAKKNKPTVAKATTRAAKPAAKASAKTSSKKK